ncbi:MAG: PilN domain-containing protein [Planctomycetales bacterium]|nr:PilN domain-containing protein [Planctomycetales bacterium]
MSVSVNLMTASARRKSALRAGLRAWITIYLAAGVGLMGLWGVQLWDLQQAKRARDAMESRYEPVKRIKADGKSADERIDALQHDERAALALAARQSALSLIGSVSEAAAGSLGAVYVQEMDVRRGDGDLADDHNPCVVQLRGLARDDAAVAGFCDRLRNSNLYRTVELKSTLAKRNGDAVMREFSVECGM